MPILPSSSYVSPRGYSNGHVQTIFSKLFRRLPPAEYQRERINTPDGDFLDLDWSRGQSRRVVILSHGLEGNSAGTYIVGMVRALRPLGWDAVAWNCRSCSGEPNRRVRFYHSGATDDLHTVIDHVLGSGRYDDLALIGFSLGGNLTLKYLGEQGAAVAPAIRRAIAYSVPCDLRASSLRLAQSFNRLYTWIFLRSLRRKIRAKRHLLPPHLHDHGYHRVRTFKDFDDRYTAPIHGFEDAEDYWRRCSSKPFLAHIRVPTLLVNARNDPFLTDECFPSEAAEANPNLWLEMPNSGGHVGFIEFRSDRMYWSERRAMEFLQAR